MHELSICRAISAVALRHAAGRPVACVCVDVGGLRQVVPATLAACWEVAVQGTELGGAQLDVHEVPVTIECRACGARTELAAPVFRCATCGGADTVVVGGDELLVTSLVLQEA